MLASNCQQGSSHAKQMLTQTKQIACEPVIIVFIIIPIIAIVLFCLLAFNSYKQNRLPVRMMQDKSPSQMLCECSYAA